MNGTDEASKEPPLPRPNWKLPEIVDLHISIIPYHESPKLRYFKSYLSRYESAVQFLVKTSEPIPLRALSPALYVGNTPVVEVQGIDENSYRFLAFEPEKLEEGAPISLGWIEQRERERVQSKFRYHREGTPHK
jgi:hypothetical protein